MSTTISSCGTITGLPSHGGGKRFAIEQELIASSARKAVKSMNLEALEGKKVALYISVIGDQGSGNFTGGRYSITNLIRGEYQNLPNSITEYSYPEYRTISNSSSDALSSQTIATSVLNSPSYTKNNTKGSNFSAGIGVNNSAVEYKNETLIQNQRDINFLNNLVQTAFFLRGIDITPPEYAEVDFFISVDVFGIIRSRTEFHIYNREELSSEIKLEYFAIDRKTKEVLIQPTNNSFSAKYKEHYALWTGPISRNKSVEKAENLLVDFADIKPYRKNKNSAINNQIKPEFNSYKDDNSADFYLENRIIKDAKNAARGQK